MKKLRTAIATRLDRFDKRWRELPIKKQHRYTFYFFLGYLILTIAVLLKVWVDTGKPDNCWVIEHIENPVIKKNDSAKSLQDSLSIILKNNMHERK